MYFFSAADTVRPLGMRKAGPVDCGADETESVPRVKSSAGVRTNPSAKIMARSPLASDCAGNRLRSLG